jgi:outer membrane protein assembly factor BamE
MSKKLILILVCSLSVLSACNIVYKQNIQQGNAIEQDKLDQLKIGMTMNQVAYLLGTPAVRDPFHQQRWDYYYSFSIRGGDPISRLVTLRFDNAILSEIKGVDFDDQEAVVNAATEAEKLAEEAEEVAEQTVSPEEPAEPVITAIETPVSETNEAIADAEPVAEVSEVIEEAVQEADELAAEAIEETIQTELAVEASGDAKWAIQLGAFDSLENAETLLERMNAEGFEGQVTLQKTIHLEDRYLVRTPGFETKALAQEQLDSLNSALELDGFLIPPEK